MRTVRPTPFRFPKGEPSSAARGMGFVKSVSATEELGCTIIPRPQTRSVAHASCAGSSGGAVLAVQRAHVERERPAAQPGTSTHRFMRVVARSRGCWRRGASRCGRRNGGGRVGPAAGRCGSDRARGSLSCRACTATEPTCRRLRCRALRQRRARHLHDVRSVLGPRPAARRRRRRVLLERRRGL